jgi:ferredoxin
LLLSLKQRYSVYTPQSIGSTLFYRKLNGVTDSAAVGDVRPAEPLKVFYLHAREQVAGDLSASSSDKPVCVVGVKACDLKAFTVFDYVFRDSPPLDPFYERARTESLVIAADCTRAIDTCFCLAMDVQPYPRKDFDLSLSPVSGGYLVEVGSEVGKAVVRDHAQLFEEPKEDLIEQRDKQRERVCEQIRENIQANAVPDQAALGGAFAKSLDSPVWQEEAGACVECGACNTVCPTCHCFFLCDQQNEARMARLRLWDSCLLKDFARVAGGGSPRPKLWMRLRNRFEKKFDFFPKVAGVYACTGCGRCVAACPAKIDIRRVMGRIASHE